MRVLSRASVQSDLALTQDEWTALKGVAKTLNGPVTAEDVALSAVARFLTAAQDANLHVLAGRASGPTEAKRWTPRPPSPRSGRLQGTGRGPLLVGRFVPADSKTLVRYASLKKEERDALFDAVHKHPEVSNVDETKLREILAQVASDRNAFAERLVAYAHAVLEAKPGDDDTANRQALMVAYDAIHHALRALHIGLEGWDPIGHQETLDEAGRMLGDGGGLGKRFEWMKLGKPINEAANDLRTQRQAAEWDVYNLNDDGKSRVDFAAEAPKAVKMAGDVVRTVKPALYDRLAGGL